MKRRQLYPPDWSDITKKVRERDGDFCTMCGAAAGEFLKKTADGYNLAEVWDIIAVGQLRKRVNFWTALKQMQMVWVVLQTSHINHDTNDNRLENLQRICQCCHMKFDAKRHAESRRYGIMHRARQMKMNFKNKM